MRVLTLLLLSALVTASLFAAFPAKDVILPAVGRVSGANGAEFYTDLYVTNPSPTEAVTFNLQFLVAGQANPSPLTVTDHLGPGQSKSYANAGETLFHLKGVLGALRVTSDRELQINSRIYNRPDGSVEAETVGAGFGGVPSQFGVASGESSVLQGIRVDGDFRYNIFLIESAGQPVALTLHLIDEHGSELKSAGYQMLGYEQKLVGVSDLLPNVNLSGAIARLDVTGGSGRVVAAGAQVANHSQDTSSFEMAFSDSRLNPGAAPGITSVSAGAGLTVNNTTGNVLVGVATLGITNALLADGSVSDAKVSGISYAKITGAPASLPPNGTAGGALAGTYPSPTLNTAGATSGQVLTFNGTSTVWGNPPASLTLPYSATATTGPPLVMLTNNGTGNALYASSLNGTAFEAFTTAPSQYAILAANGNGTAIYATGNSTTTASIIARNDGVPPSLYAFKDAFHSGAAARFENLNTSNASPPLIVSTASSGLAAAITGNVIVAGSVQVTGNLSKGGGSFKIDHPLDPQNKYLYHSFVESPDMKNIYDGVVTTDANGRAVIELPDWFEALNQDFRYQLTAIGAAAPGLYVARKIEGNHFEIAGALPNMEVSWQVTGVRHDAYANRHRIPVEEAKEPESRGTYLHPEAFGEQ